MSDDSPDMQTGRRSFMKTVGAFGAAASVGSAATGTVAAQSGDSYRETLQAELTASDRQSRQLPEGTFAYGDSEADAIDAFSLQGDGSTTEFEVDSDRVSFTQAERVDVTAADEDDPGAVAYRGPVPDADFSEGDLLLGVAWVRSEDHDAQARAAFRYGDGEDFVDRGADVDPTGEWMRYFFPIEIGSVPDGDADPVLELHLGYDEQVVEFGGVALLDYSDTDVGLSTLPPYDYAGRAEDAEWREAAHERIEEIRKTDFEVEVRNPGGQPMEDANVSVSMLDHAFDFGSAVSVEHVVGDSDDDETYRQTFLEHFNKAVVENALKYPAWEGEWDIRKEDTRATLDWLNEHDIPTRGHYLLWEQDQTDGGGGMHVDPDLPADEKREVIAEKIANHAAEFEGDIAEWDMHNHPVWQSNYRDDEDLGWDAIDEWWSVADENTDVGLHTNEMGAIGGQWQRSAYSDYIAHLVENDYPIDAIGFMGHHQQRWGQLLDIEDMIAGYDEFAQYDLPMIVTEFDIEIFDRRNAQDVAVQRDYLRDFLTVAFSRELVESVMSWGFWEDDHWRPTGAYYDSDWTLREHGEEFLELIYDEWWTDELGRTDGDGVYATRGFKGDYEITAEKGNLSGETTVTIDDDTDTVVVELVPPGKQKDDKGGNGNGKGKDKGGNPWSQEGDGFPDGSDEELFNETEGELFNETDGSFWNESETGFGN
ncbi:endo-1,4-beta-xylanase [Halomicrobium salinisoli]|uniref:endo-1,4-beta-xylanase n=1 Tax=Halomicrobium salinisoli TaxID=2878391 RepID=UPI001CEFF0E6|nr:endo-1,4-beta-xylanase [Halomicrobium salinisoli]